MEAVGNDLRGMAQCEAEEAIYSSATEHVISGIDEE